MKTTLAGSIAIALLAALLALPSAASSDLSLHGEFDGDLQRQVDGDLQREVEINSSDDGTAATSATSSPTNLAVTPAEVTLTNSGLASSVSGATLTVVQVAAPTAPALSPLAGYQSSSIPTGVNSVFYAWLLNRVHSGPF